MYAGSHQSSHHAQGYCMTRDQIPFGPAYQPFRRFSLTTLQPGLHSQRALWVSLSTLAPHCVWCSAGVATCSTGSPHRLAVYRLSFPLLTRIYIMPFRVPNARQGKVLSLHHLKDKSFTYMNTQLSKYNDLAAHPRYRMTPFRANGSHPQAVADRLIARMVSGAIGMHWFG